MENKKKIHSTIWKINNSQLEKLLNILDVQIISIKWKLNSKIKFSNNSSFIILGGGSKFGTTKCKTADISKIQNFEYWNNESWVSRFFLFFYFISYIYVCLNCSNTSNIWLFTIKFEILGISIVIQIVKFWKFANFWNSKISGIWLFFFRVCQQRKFNDFHNCGIWEIFGIFFSI